ncbi:MAG: hypothetical protein J6Q18_01710, partial [Oscillospiraceae bacterium]|nr:hypothetical protein [Oscillospiraceae bacterium]
MEEKDIVTTDTGVEVQEVAAPESEGQVEQAMETQPAAEKTDRDAYYADLRRKQELDQARADNARLQQQMEMVQKTLGNFFEGATLEEQLDYASAQAQGIDVTEYRKQREEQQQAQAVQQELQMYRQREIDRMMADDLKAVQAIDPTVTSLKDLPETFLALRFNQAAPMSARDAFIATKAISQQTKTPKPASVGSISGSGTA